MARHLHNFPSESPVRPGTHCASSALTPLVQAREAGAPTAFPVPPRPPRTLPRCRFRERSLPAVLSARESPPSVLAATSSSRPGGSGRFLHGDVRPRGCTGAASPRVRSPAPILPFLPFCLVRRAFSVPSRLPRQQRLESELPEASAALLAVVTCRVWQCLLVAVTATAMRPQEPRL